MQITRVYLDRDPYIEQSRSQPWIERGAWPCRWIGCEVSLLPFIAVYRCQFALHEAETLRLHITADERYELFVDGERIARGSERGDPNNWFFETYDLELAAGDHILVALVFTLGVAGPRSQMSVRHGFLLAPQGEQHIALIGTGVAPWQTMPLRGYSFQRPFGHDFFSIGYNVVIDGCNYSWGIERGLGQGWQQAKVLDTGADALLRNRYAAVHLLRPATLPPMLDQPWRSGRVRFVTHALEEQAILQAYDHPVDHALWSSLLHGESIAIVPPHASRRVLFDLEGYVCAHVMLTVSGGVNGMLRLHWAEALFCDPEGITKGNRNEVEGKYFVGVGDTFLPDGGKQRTFASPLWRAGRYLELVVQTADELLTIEQLVVSETRYPLDVESTFEADNPQYGQLIAAALRTIQTSCHDSYIDGPYYEQMPWAGDAVQHALCTYVLTRDDRLQRKLLRMFAASQLPSGFTRARYPARDTLIIAPYGLYFVTLVHDYAFWRDDLAFVREMMVTARRVLEAFLLLRNAEGLIEAPPGWNFMDWVPAWESGVPPDADWGASAVINWQAVWAFSRAATVEAALGEHELAARWRRLAGELASHAIEVFWNTQRQLFADDIAHTSFSEHTQCFALLSGELEPDHATRLGHALVDDQQLTRAAIGFGHHLFEAYRSLGRVDLLQNRLGFWFELIEQGFVTLPERPEPSRSDCHAWSAHPLYHFFASIIGIRPASAGFKEVLVAPQLGRLGEVRGRIPHPCGQIEARFKRENGRVRGEIALPVDTTGTFLYNGQHMPLASGLNRIEIGIGHETNN